LRREYLHVTYIIPGRGLRMAMMRIVEDGGGRPKEVMYPASGDPCTERGFTLYLAGRRGELRLRVPSESPRRLRRFLRDWVKHEGGGVWSVNMWVTPWR